MNFNTVDLHKELIKSKKKVKSNLIEEVNTILKDQAEAEKEIHARVSGGKQKQVYNAEDFDTENIYTLEQIKKICIKYRLRFLDSKSFVGEIPYEAILKIKDLERRVGEPLNGFKIVAPKELFKLEDKDSDPLLFLQLADNKFYFIHKWGGELNRFRSILAAPLRSFMSMFWFLAAVSFVFSLLVPTSSFDVFAFLFVHSFIAICGIACMLILSMRENFSDVEWNSKFFS